MEHELVAVTSFDEFFELRRGHLVRLAHLLLNDLGDAEDVAQEVLEQLYRRWDTIRPDTALAYARTAIVNRSRSLQRRRVVARRFALRQSPEIVVPEPVADQGLWNLVTGLPGRQREVIVLRYWCDLPDADIAQILGISAGTVKSTSHAARARLADLLQEGEHNEPSSHSQEGVQ